MSILIPYPGTVMHKGKLYLIPTPLGKSSPDTIFPKRNLDIICKLNHFIVEEIRTARRFLRIAGIDKDLQDEMFMIFNEHSKNADLHIYLKPSIDGFDIGLLSEAGLPCVADPGSLIVAQAHQHGIQVIPLTGPSSVFLALMASGFNGQNFTFSGYLPVDKTQRKKSIRELERISYEKDQTQIFIETPYRNLQLFNTLLETCNENTALCIAVDLSTDDEWIMTRTIREWKMIHPELRKRPAIFLLYFRL